eukprot:CAMPEP_0194387896 /NCGR_PEP_ID=MMETSP0174-20130528/95147_1 /TAXON_ID=216777 /ORGANISM="Proboscia alata, Strain PI-D3" /LENGTH=71 /DNA_ID=CAMNT_0039178595 /DNA_START=87 /DNA_END=302 /DNA_ORIENTATION=-
MTDTTPLVNIKLALQGIKSEIKSFDLQIGIVEHVLLQTRLENSRAEKENLQVAMNEIDDASFEELSHGEHL